MTIDGGMTDELALGLYLPVMMLLQLLNPPVDDAISITNYRIGMEEIFGSFWFP